MKCFHCCKLHKDYSSFQFASVNLPQIAGQISSAMDVTVFQVRLQIMKLLQINNASNVLHTYLTTCYKIIQHNVVFRL